MAAVAVISLRYRKQGTTPPVFVAGTFSNPPWEPKEMDYITDKDGEHTFFKTYEVTFNMEVQYKFRIGHGDWWVVSEDAPTTTDASGNMNNVLKPNHVSLVRQLGLESSEDPMDADTERQAGEDGLDSSERETESDEVADDRSTDHTFDEATSSDAKTESNQESSEDEERVEKTHAATSTVGIAHDGCSEHHSEEMTTGESETKPTTGEEHHEEISPPALGQEDKEAEGLSPDEGISLPHETTHGEVLVKLESDDSAFDLSPTEPAAAHGRSLEESGSKDQEPPAVGSHGDDEELPLSPSKILIDVASETRQRSDTATSTSAISSSDSVTGSVTACGTEVDPAEPESNLRERRRVQKETEDETSDEPSDDAEEDKGSGQSWFGRLMEWIKNFFHSLFGGKPVGVALE